MMRTIIIGKPTDFHKRMHAACLEAIEACEDKIFPNALMGDVLMPIQKYLINTDSVMLNSRHVDMEWEQFLIQYGWISQCFMKAIH